MAFQSWDSNDFINENKLVRILNTPILFELRPFHPNQSSDVYFIAAPRKERNSGLSAAVDSLCFADFVPPRCENDRAAIPYECGGKPLRNVNSPGDPAVGEAQRHGRHSPGRGHRRIDPLKPTWLRRNLKRPES